MSRTPLFNSETSAAHLQIILDTYPDVPVLLFWDRATWHGGPSVHQLLDANPRLEISSFRRVPRISIPRNMSGSSPGGRSVTIIFLKLPDLVDRFEEHLRSRPFASSFLDRYGYHAICPFLN